MTTLSEVDEALHHTSLVPPDCRGEGWHAWVDALLEQRAELVPENDGGEGAPPNHPKRKARALPIKERK
jgi:hypothetical protein